MATGTGKRTRRTAEEAARGRAREALNRVLDSLGGRLATPAEAVELVRIAGAAFAPGTAAIKLARALFRLAATCGGDHQ